MRFGIFSIVILAIDTALFMLVVINAFSTNTPQLDDAKLWHVSSAFGFWFATIVAKVYPIVALILPVIFNYYVADYIEDIKMDISPDVTDILENLSVENLDESVL